RVTHTAAVDHAGTAPTAFLAGHYGRGLSVVRSPLPHRHRVGKIGPAPSTGPSLPAGPPHLAAALFCQPGESVDFPGRFSASLNLQCGGAPQSPTPQDAENGLPRANPGTPHRPHRSRYA